MRIAYVEDNATNLALVERVAGMNRHAVVSYAEGEVAAQELLQERFDLILMDVELAGEMSGLQVVRDLRQAGLKTPIIAVTAYAMLGDQERCLEAGCDGYLPKPLPITELLVLLAKYEAATQATPEPVATAQLVGASQAAGSSVTSASPTATPAPPTPAAASNPVSPVAPASPAPAAPSVNTAPASAPVTPTPPAPSVKVAPTGAPVPPMPPAPASTADAPTKPVPGPDAPALSNPITPDKRVP